MSHTFGGEIRLEGEKEYRDALKQINSDLRVLGSEMGKVTAEFGKNNDSTESLANKNKVLAEQIDKQREKIETLKGALSDSSEKYGENDLKTEKWQVTLNKAESDLIKMQKELDGNTQKMEEGGSATDDNSESLNKFGKSVEDAGEKTLTLGDIIKASLISEAIITGLKKLGEALKSSVDYIKTAVSNAAKYGDEMLTLSTKTGVSTKTLQEFSAVQELIDVDLNTFTSTLAKNTKSMASAQSGTGEAAKAYQNLGVSISDTNGNLRSSEEVFWDSIDALKNIENATERDAIAMQLFGKSAQELNPLIAQGSEGFKNLTDQAYAMGAVLSDDVLQSLGNLDDQMQIWQGTLAATSNLIGALFAPAMTEITKSANEVGMAFNSLILAILDGDEDISEEMENFSKSIENLAKTIAEKMPEFLRLGGLIIKGIWDGLVGAISEYLPQIIGGLLLIASAVIAFGPTLMAAFVAITPWITSGLALLSSILVTWPVLLGAAIVGALVLFWPQISKMFQNIWSGLSEFFGNLWTNIKEFLSNHWQDLLLWIFAWPVALIKTLSDFWPQISTWLSNLWSNILNWLSNTWNNITKWFTDLKDNMVNKAKEIIENLKTWFSKLPENIWNAIIGATTKHSGNQQKATRIITDAPWVREHCLFKENSRIELNIGQSIGQSNEEYSKPAIQQGSDYYRMLKFLCSWTQMGRNKYDDVVDGMSQLARFAQSLSGSIVQVFARPF